MADLQWFKFSPLSWGFGKIQKCPEITQARFINMCSLYWTKECVLSVEDTIIEIDQEHFDVLLAKKIISTSGEYIHISFLDEQFVEYKESTQDQSTKGIVGNLKRWHKDIYNQYEQKKISLQEAVELSKKPIAPPSPPDRTPIAEQSQSNPDPILTPSLIIADKIREEEDKNKLEENREDKEEKKEIESVPHPPTPALKVDLKNQQPAPKIDYERLVDFFNVNRGIMPEVIKISAKRKTTIKNLIQKHKKEALIKVIEECRDSDFMQGRGSSGWVGSFDWITKEENFIKILEGNYKNLPNGKPKPTSEKSNAEIFAETINSEAARNFRFSK